MAAADRRDRLGPVIEALLRDEPGDFVLPAPVTAEVDYLLGRRLGRSARLAFLDDLAAGRFTVACLDADDHAVVAEIVRRAADRAGEHGTGRASNRGVDVVVDATVERAGSMDGGAASDVAKAAP